MKIRSGFVSNSSSSSYIIGVGRVADETALVEYCNKNHIDYKIVTTKEILEFKFNWSYIKRVINEMTYLVNNAFDGNEVMLEIDPNINEKFVSINHSEEMEESEDGETNYDIDSGYFNKTGQAIFDIASCSFVKNWEVSYGAGRNG